MTNFLKKSLDQAPKTWLAIGFGISLFASLWTIFSSPTKQLGFVLGIGLGVMFAAFHRLIKWKT